MKTKRTRQLEFILADEVFDAAADMAENLGVPILTEEYSLFDAIVGEIEKVLRATNGWEQFHSLENIRIARDALYRTRLFEFLWRLYSSIPGREPPAPPQTPEYRTARMNSIPIYRSLKDVSKDELCQAVVKLSAGLNVPIRTEHYDLVLAIYDEKIKDRKAFVSHEVA